MSGYLVTHDFDNVGFSSTARSFAGFPKALHGSMKDIVPRQAIKMELRTGDLLSISGVEGSVSIKISAFGARGEDALKLLGLKADGPLDTTLADCAELKAWIASQGGETSAEIMVAGVPSDSLPLVFAAKSRMTIWIINALPNEDLITSANNADSVSITHQPKDTSGIILPPALGEIRDEFTVKRGTGHAYEVRRGEYLQIIDVEGQQCSDFMAFRAKELARGQEWLIDSTATRSMVRRAYPGPGPLDKFFDQDMQPMLAVVQDTCGRHDTLGLACTARGYADRGFPGHVNCSDNISEALSPFGVARRSAWPAINFFWNSWVDPHSYDLLTAESHSRPGDYVAMRAMEDLVCVSTACPDDIDPINGWNPTDVHVRIYRAEAQIRRAVAYRKMEDAPMSISQESAFHDRTGNLTRSFAPTRDLWIPVSFPSFGTLGEYWACREKVTLQDMSGLRKFDIIGPDAERLLQLATTRNIAKLPVWRGTYTLLCDETGSVIDDGTLFRLASELFRWCCGSEESGRRLEKLAKENALQVRIHDLQNALPNLALQGPHSRDVLRKIIFTQPSVPALDQIKWFGVTVARLNDRTGAPFMLTRSGYTGELGYEIFCTTTDAVQIWDAVMEAGEEFGITPMGTAALDIIRVEAGLAAAGAEFAPGIDAFEAGLGFAVDMTKLQFCGKAALERNAVAPRRVLKGLLLDCDDVPAHGAPIFAGERQVGTVTSATRSPMRECAIAMARLSVEYSAKDTQLEIGQLDGRMKRLGALVTDIPFFDPKRERARA